MHNPCVQYGCGFTAPDTWLNFDASPTLRFERLPVLGKLYTKNSQRFPHNVHYGDIVRGLPVPERSCEAIYCSHVLEHLAYNDFVLALANTRKLLARGGVFRLVVPDLRFYATRYLNDPAPRAAEDFLNATGLGVRSSAKSLPGFVKAWLGNSQHLWMWDYGTLHYELERAGFEDIRRAQYGDSGDARFVQVEHPDRWQEAVGIECRG
jgi:SAM-dependent methyltransferase